VSASHDMSAILHQPKAVWAVAFASVVAFTGIGAVGPILPAISDQLGASPVQAELLFTSYLTVTGLAMFVTSWVSGRIGTRATLLVGLGLIAVFAALAGSSGSVEEIISFRAGWGLGNALFISTALATIVGSAAGGSASAIVIYEAALGLGIAIGPLLGGTLGAVSWRGPFFGAATLMALAFIALMAFSRTDAAPRVRVRLSAPLRALAHPGLRLLAIAALLYNVGFFVLLSYSPFPLSFSAMALGLTFFGWGLGLATTSVVVAPMLTARFPRTVVLYSALGALAALLAMGALVVSSSTSLVVVIIAGGFALGIVNTVLTECVMEVTDLPRTVASSSYSGVRFLGGAIAPPLAAYLADLQGPWLAYAMAACAVLASGVLVLTGQKTLAHVDLVHAEPAQVEAQAIAVGDAA